MSSAGDAAYIAFSAISIVVLKTLNEIVTEPYMDEPFHIPQAQAYCEGHFDVWDPKITTPPGLYILSLILKQVFRLKCNVPMLRLTPLLTLLALPLVLTRLLYYHQRERPRSSILVPSFDAVVLSTFPIAWFFGFLYYTELPSLVSVVLTVVFASQNRHWLAALLGAISCTFRQTNIVWVLYAYASSQLMFLRFHRKTHLATLHDPPALTSQLGDLLKALLSAPRVVPQILPAFLPYCLVLVGFFGFVIWNAGIVLGDKSNHVPAFHVPQVYYFIGFATLFGWPALLSGSDTVLNLVREVRKRMFGSTRNTMFTGLVCIVMAVTIRKFTIHHPFLLADNRHYTFYIWRRVFMAHPVVPYLLIPGYLACAWAWYIRIGQDQTLLQNLLVPVFLVPTLLPTPLLEPRYFLIPYVLLRAQIVDVTFGGLVVEGLWYGVINAATMYVFLFQERAGVGRFMW
ncbi:glucosyltransferase [Abortiporus biennis]|nr:glucosyltransferase [Abortiporus biennis]